MQALSSDGDVYAGGCSTQACRKAEVQAKIAAEFIRSDPVFWERVLGIWKKATKATHTVRTREYHSLEEYLSFRVSDAYVE